MKIRHAFTILILLLGGISVPFALHFGKAEKDERPDTIAIDPHEEAAYYSDSARPEEALYLYEGLFNEDPTDTDAIRGIIKNAAALNDRPKLYDAYDRLIELQAAGADEITEYTSLLMEDNNTEKFAEVTGEAAEWCDDEQIASLYNLSHVRVPSFNLKGGSYAEYQLLELIDPQEDCTVYYTIDGSDPTPASTRYKDPIIISFPQTTIRAIAVSSLNYVSEEASLSFTITAPVTEYERTARASLINSIRSNIFSKGYRDVLYSYELAQITELCIVGTETPSAYLNGYTFYEGAYSHNGGTRRTQMGSYDLSILSEMPFLQRLAVCNVRNVDLEVIGNLEYLTELSLLNDQIDDISALRRLNHLKTLSLGWNQISGIYALVDLTDLESLGLWSNEISDISPLGKLTGLKTLDLSDNSISDLSALENLSELTELWISGNPVGDLSVLDRCEQLTDIH